MTSLFANQFFLAFAEGGDPNADNLLYIVVILSIILAAAVLAIIPITFARRVHPRFFDVIIAATVLWSLLLAGISIWTFLSQHQWSIEYNLRLQSGYFRSNQIPGAPPIPWIPWALLALTYLPLLFFASRRPKIKPPPSRFEVLPPR